MQNEAQKLFKAAQAGTVKMTVYTPGEAPDYIGTDADKAWAAASACEEMHVKFEGNDNVGLLGWALICPDLAPDEIVADYSGDWIEQALA